MSSDISEDDSSESEAILSIPNRLFRSLKLSSIFILAL